MYLDLIPIGKTVEHTHLSTLEYSHEQVQLGTNNIETHSNMSQAQEFNNAEKILLNTDCADNSTSCRNLDLRHRSSLVQMEQVLVSPDPLVSISNFIIFLLFFILYRAKFGL